MILVPVQYNITNAVALAELRVLVTHPGTNRGGMITRAPGFAALRNDPRFLPRFCLAKPSTTKLPPRHQPRISPQSSDQKWLLSGSVRRYLLLMTDRLRAFTNARADR